MSIDALTHLIEVYRYWILIPLSFIEGPIVSFVAGALASLGYFNPLFAFAIFIFKDVIVDGTYYYLGRLGAKKEWVKRWLAKIGVSEKQIAEVRLLWNKNFGKAMFFSKLSWGLSPAFLAIAGIIEMPVRKFFEYAVLIAFLQYGILFVLGYYFGNSFGTISGLLDNIQYAILVITLFATVYYGFKWYIQRKLLKEEEDVGKELEDNNKAK